MSNVNEVDEAVGVFMRSMMAAANVFVASVRKGVARQTSDAITRFFTQESAALRETVAEPAPPRQRPVIKIVAEPRRSKAALASLERDFVKFVKANPGLRIEQINEKMFTTTEALRLPARRAIASGTIVVKGTKRAARYFPGRKAK